MPTLLSQWEVAPVYMQSSWHIPVLRDSCSWCCLPKTLMPSSSEKKNPRKTAKLLWPLWLHKGTVHFYQIFASSVKECFCKQHTSSRNQNLGLQLAFALLQKHLEHSTHWITTQRKRIPWLNVFPLHLIRTAKEQATDKGPVDAHNKMHRLVYHLLSSTS